MGAPSLILPTQTSVVRFRFARRGQQKRPQQPDGRFLLAPAIDTAVKGANQQVVVVLRNPTFDQDPGNPPGIVALQGCPPNFGADPNDPAAFPPSVDPGSAVCGMLSAYAMASCLSRGRYF